MIVHYVFVFSVLLYQCTGLPTNEPLQVEREEGYRGYKVLAITPEDESQLSELKDFMWKARLFNCSLDWWNIPRFVAVPVTVSVNPECVNFFTFRLQDDGFSFNITVSDLQDLITEEQNYRLLSQFYRDPFSWNEEVYHTLPEINERINQLVETYPDLLSTRTLATSHEERSIDVVIVRQPGKINKPVIWIDCGMHAREWISPPVCLHAIDQLIVGQNAVDPEDNLLNLFDFYILPVVNPDGYAYSWGISRLWRKNRRPLKDEGAESSKWEKCDYGVDPNRNFPIAFDHLGPQSYPCDDSYHGTKPFSEPESRAVRNGVRMMKRIYGKKNIAAFVDIHAYSQLWLSPYGYREDASEDYEDHMRVMKEGVEALGAVYGTEFEYGPSATTIYKSYGNSLDWAYEEAGIKYTFGLELREKIDSFYGFMLPQEQIIPVTRETWAGLSAMARTIAPEIRFKSKKNKNQQ